MLIIKNLYKKVEKKRPNYKKPEKKQIIDNNTDAYYDLNTSDNDSLVTLLLVLINPTIVLIDHGHFQYNSISLGLTQLALYFLLNTDTNANTKVKLKWLISASILFCMALNYKQMELYHALPFFFYLLGLALFKSNCYKHRFVIIKAFK